MTHDRICARWTPGGPRAEISRELGVGRNTVAKRADMEDMSPAPPVPARRARPAVDAYAAWIGSVLEADLGAPRKQRRTAKRIYDRMVDELGYAGSYSSVSRFVERSDKRGHAEACGEGGTVRNPASLVV